MRVFTCVDHAGHWAVGVASVVIAQNEDEARRLLSAELDTQGLNREPFTLHEINTRESRAFVLNNGDY